MANLILSLNVVLPLFLLMASGYAARKLKLYDSHAHAKMNGLVFKFFLPVLLFNNIYSISPDTDINPRLYVFTAISVLVMFGVLFAVVPAFEKDNRRRSVLIQGIGRSNFVLFGIPLAGMLCEGDFGAASLLVIVIVPLFNVFSVTTLEIYRGEKTNAGKILLGIVKNPLIIGSVAGLAVRLAGIRFPLVVEAFISDLSDVATPFSLFLLGGALEFSRVSSNARVLAAGVSGRLVVMPLIFITAAVLLGFRGAELVSVMAVFMSPTAVSSYTMAQQMGADGELAGQQVVFTTAFSILTIFLWVFAAKQMGFI